MLQPKDVERIAKEAQPIATYLPGVETELLTRSDEPKISIKSLPELNKRLWGLRPGLTVVGARTSQGKSAFSLQIAHDVADQSHHVLFLSLEMNVESLIERLFCNVMKVNNYDTLTGKIKYDEAIKHKWETFKGILGRTKLLITNGIGKSFQEVNFMIEALDPKPKMVVVDYIQAVRQTENERIELNEYIRHFRALCVKYQIAGVLCSQINRGALQEKNYEPHMGLLKSTGVLEEHADTCILLHWQHFYTYKEQKQNEFKIIIAKQRNGRTGEYMVNFFPEFYRFEEMEVV